MAVAVGGNLKGYELKERIGTGGFGAVYRAYQTTIGREVAIKIILPSFANQPDFIRRFEGEAQFVARLEHPHITPLYDYWRDRQGAYLVMRWLRGGSLRDALQKGPFELRAAALLLDQVAGALSLAHRNGVIHRDIKPGNILLDEDGNAYLTDFGIAKDLNLPGDNTQPDAIVGSLDYISPEQARSEPVTPRTDIYSLGVTMYETLVGQHPFQHVSSVERLYKHINDPMPKIVLPDETVASEVNRVIQKATAKNPEHRYPDALAFAADFREAMGFNRTPTDVVELLTPREQEVLQLIIDGLSNREIAQRLTVTLSTVKWYVNQVYSKLGVRSRVQAIVRARELDLIVTSGEEATYVPLPTEDFHPGNPYKGLRAFQSADYQDFFGREKVTAKLIRRLSDTGEYSRFLAVIGPSGSGKSSLVKAGLIPALWRGDLPGSEKWFVVEILPGSRPLDELEVGLSKVAANQAGNLREHLQRDQYGLLRAANLILPNDGSDLMLIIDQFEEIFTLVENEADRRHFLDLLHAAVTDPRSRVRVVVTLRADFYDRPLYYPRFGELVRSRLETVMPLSADELERAIAKPAERVGVAYEPGLISSIVADVNYQPGALPLLQYALTELFERREGRLLTREAYQAIGGTVGALARRADELYLTLNDDKREMVRQMFLRLVTLGEGKEDTRRRVPRSELLAIISEPDEMDELIDTYVAYRLLALDTEPSTRSPMVEVAHEALLREWEHLRTWLKESRDEIRLQRQLSAMAAEWTAVNQNAGFLARGPRLEQFERWAADTQLALTPVERTYLETSLAERAREHQAEQERQAHEARLERRSRNFLRSLVAVLVLAMLVAFGLTGIAVNQSSIARVERDNARRSAAESQYVALVAGSQAAFAKGDLDSAIALAMEAVNLDRQSGAAQVALSEAAYQPGTIRRFEGHTQPINTVAISPDGQTAVSASADNTLILWDIQTGEIIRRFEGHTDVVAGVEFTPDGRSIISCSDDATLIQWNVQTAEIIRRFEGHTGQVWSLVLSPDGLTMLSIADGFEMILWDVQTGEIIRYLDTGDTHPTEGVAVDSIDFSPDGKTVLTGSWDNTLILWDVQTGAVIRRFGADGEGHFSPVEAVRFSPDGRWALSGAQESTLILWDVASGQVIRRFGADGQLILGLAFSQDGHTALSADIKGAVTLWNLDTGEQLHRFQGGAPALSVAFAPDGRTALSSSGDNTLRLWDLEGGQIIRQFSGHSKGIIALSRSPDGRLALSTSEDFVTILWNVQTGQEIRRVSRPAMVLDYAPDGETALLATIPASSSDTGDLFLWDTETGREVRHFGPLPSTVQSAAFSPDGHMVVSGDYLSTIIILWDATTGQEIRRLTGYESTAVNGSVIAVEFGPDGGRIFTTFINGVIVEWDTATGEIIRKLPEGRPILSVNSYSFLGDMALVGRINGEATLWDSANGLILGDVAHHSQPITAVQITPDGRFGISGSADSTTVLWDLQTGEMLRRWSGENNGATALALSPDGRDAVVGFSDGRVELWRIDTTLDDLTTWVRANRYIPELTCEQRDLYQLEPLCPETTPASADFSG
jgi:WD40 repeat protein/serine/threonine protein kinase